MGMAEGCQREPTARPTLGMLYRSCPSPAPVSAYRGRASSSPRADSDPRVAPEPRIPGEYHAVQRSVGIKNARDGVFRGLPTGAMLPRTAGFTEDNRMQLCGARWSTQRSVNAASGGFCRVPGIHQCLHRRATSLGSGAGLRGVRIDWGRPIPRGCCGGMTGLIEGERWRVSGCRNRPVPLRSRGRLRSIRAPFSPCNGVEETTP